MTLPLTPEILRAAYDFLCTTPPFSKWNMPPGEDVKFRVLRGSPHRLDYGEYQFVKRKHVISVMRARTGHTLSLMVLMAHEMVHLYEQETGFATAAQHTKTFLKLAERVCKYHGFDPKAF